MSSEMMLMLLQLRIDPFVANVVKVVKVVSVGIGD